MAAIAPIVAGAAGAAATSYMGYAGASAIAYSVLSTAVTAYMRVPNKTYGPRLSDLRYTGSKYGAVINRVYGTMKVNAIIDILPEIKEHSKKKKLSSKGFLGKKDTETTYSYYADVSFLFTANEVSALRKIYANEELVYDTSKSNTGITTALSYSALKFYKGTADQMPDATLEAIYGSGRVPAKRYMSYTVLDNWSLNAWQGAVPNITAEIVGKVSEFDTSTETDFVLQDEAYLQTNSSKVWVNNQTQMKYGVTGTSPVEVTDMASGAKVLKPRVRYNDSDTNNTPFLADNLIFESLYAFEGGNYKDKILGFSDQYDLKYVMNITDFNFYDATKFPNGGNLCWAERVGLENYTLFFSPTNSRPYLAIVKINSFSSNITNYVFYVDMSTTEANKCYDIKNSSAYDTGNVFITNYTNFYFRRQNGNDTEVCKIRVDAINPVIELVCTFENQNFSIPSSTVFYYDEITNSIISSGVDLVTGTSASNQSIMKFDMNNNNITKQNVLSYYFNGLSVPSTNNGPFFADDGSLYAFCSVSAGGANRTVYFAQISIANLASFSLVQSTQTGITFGYTKTWFNTKLQYLFTNRAGSYSGIQKLYMNRSIKRTNTAYEIIKDICLDGGLKEGQFDVTDIKDIIIRGFAITSSAELKQSAQQLCDIYDFEIIETNYILKFKKAKRAVSAIINMNELGAQTYSNSTSYADLFNIEDTEELDLPRRIEITYLDGDNNYAQSMQSATNYQSKSLNIVQNEYPVVLTAQEAKIMAQRILDMAYTSRYTYTFNLNMDYYGLESGDVIQVFDGSINKTYTMKINSMQIDAGIIKISAKSYSNIIYDQYAIADAGQGIGVEDTIKIQSDSLYYFMDLPLLTQQDMVGAYVTSAPRYRDGEWNGSVIQTSKTGLNFQTVNSFDVPGNTGYSTSVLASFGDSNVFDFFNTVTVYAREELESKTQTDILNGENTCLIGNEIIQFLSATPVGVDIYELSGLLRGRFQTDTTNHSRSEIFVMLDFESIQNMPLEINQVNSNIYTRVVTAGKEVDNAQINAEQWTGISQKPLAVQKVEYNVGNNIWNFHWYEVLRGQAYLINGTTPIDLDGSSYDIEFLDSSNNGTVVATRNVTNATSFTYTSAMQVADYGSNQSTLRFNIYKINPKYGRGKPKYVVTSNPAP